MLQLLQPQQRASDRRNPLFCSLLLLALAPLESVAARVQTSPIITLSLSAMIPMVSIIIHGYPSIPPRAAIIPISRRNYPRYYVLPTFLRNVSSRATSFHLFFLPFVSSSSSSSSFCPLFLFFKKRVTRVLEMFSGRYWIPFPENGKLWRLHHKMMNRKTT